MSRPTPQCPIRPGEPCTLCQAYVTGPEDCQTVKLVMEDEDLRAELAVKRRQYRERMRQAQGGS